MLEDIKIINDFISIEDEKYLLKNIENLHNFETDKEDLYYSTPLFFKGYNDLVNEYSKIDFNCVSVNVFKNGKGVCNENLNSSYYTENYSFLLLKNNCYSYFEDNEKNNEFIIKFIPNRSLVCINNISHLFMVRNFNSKEIVVVLFRELRRNANILRVA